MMDVHVGRISHGQPEVSDQALLERAHAGDTSAFEQIVSRYQARLSSFIGRYLGDDEQANDVVQFVFLQLYLSLPRLHGRLDFLRSATSLKAWLFQVAYNRCTDEFRLRKKRPLPFSELESGTDEEFFRISTLPGSETRPAGLDCAPLNIQSSWSRYL